MTKVWERSGGVYLHNGTTPTTQDALQIAAPPVGYTLTRTRVDLQLSVIAATTGGSISVDYWTEVLIAVGVWFQSSAVAPTTSDTPLTTPTDPGWVIWDMLYPHVDIYDTGTPTSTVTWSSRGGLLESFAKRKAAVVGHGTTLWLAWETIDASGLINSVTATNTYYLGGASQTQALYDSV